MSLKNIGNIFNARNDIDKLLDIVGAIGDLDAAANALKQVQGISDDIKVDLLWRSIDGVDEAAAKAALGISKTGAAAAGATAEVSGLGAAIKGAFTAHPFVTAGTAALAFGAIIYSIYRGYKKEMIEGANEATSAWNSATATLEEQKQKYVELKAAIDSGSLSPEEEYNTKKQILDIQNQIIESYGAQAGNIDLVNGNLQTQLGLIEQISQKEAQRSLNENKQEYDDAVKEMTKERTYDLGGFNPNQGTSDYKKSVADIQDIAKGFEKQGIHLEKNSHGYGYTIRFRGDASQADEVINEFATKVKELEGKYGENNPAINSIATNSASALKENSKLLEVYQGNYKAFLEQDMYSKGVGKNDPAGIFNSYAEAVKNYNDALAANDDDKIADSAQKFEAVQKSVDGVIQKYPEYTGMFNEVGDQLDTAAINARDFNKELSGGELKKYVDAIKDKELSDVELMSLSDGSLASWDKIKQKAEECGISIEDVSAMLVNLGAVSGQVGEQVANALDINATPLMEGVEEALESKNAGDNYTQMEGYFKKAKDLYDQGLVGTDDFKSIAKLLSPTGMDDPANFIENYGKALRYFDSDSTKGVNNFLNDLSKHTNDAGEALATFNKETGEWSYNIGDLEAAAQEMGIGFEPFMAMLGRLQDYGASNNFVSSIEDGTAHIADLYTQLAQEEAKLKELTSPGEYDTGEGENGGSTLGNQTAIDATKAKIEELKGSIGETMDVMDQLLNKSSEDYDSQVSAAKDAISQLQEQKESVLSAGGDNADSVAAMIQEQIDALAEEYHIDLDVDVNKSGDVDGVTSEIESIQDQIQEVNSNNVLSVDARADKLQDLQSQLESVISEKQELTSPIIMNVDTSGMDSGAQATISKIQELYSAFNELESLQIQKEAGLNIDDSQIEAAKGKIQGLADELNGMEASKTLGIDAKVENVDTSSIDSIRASLNALTANVVSVNFPDKVDDTEGTANYDLGESPDKVPDASGTANFTLGDYPKSVPSVTQTVIQKVVPPSPFSVVNGTAHANGTAGLYPIPKLSSRALAFGSLKDKKAYAGGDWGTKEGGTALVGELGQELVVYGNRWWTVGDNHVEFANIPKGAIVFNHLQTEEILKNGWTAGRGTSYANGTAYAGVSGGVKFQGGASSSSKKSSSSSKKSGNSSSSATKKNTAAVNKNTKATDDNTKTFDHIETLVDRITSALDSLERQAKDLQNTYTTQNPLLVKAISQAQSNMSTLQKSADYYFNKANSVGISESYKNKLRNGQISIEDIKDENLAEKMEDFQKWYELGLKMKDEMEELKVKIKELNMQKLDNIKDSFSAAVDYYDAVSDVFQNSIDLAEAQGKLGKESDYVNMINQNNQARAMLKGEYNSLTQQLNELISNGTIKKYTNDWYEWQSTLEEIRGDIIDIDKTIIELRKDILEVRWDNFNKSITKIDNMKDSLSSLSDLIEDTMVYVEDTSKISGMGYGKLALLQSELIQAKQAVVNYGVAIDKLQEEYQKGFYSQEQYEEKLADLRKSQLDYVGDIKKAKDAILDLVKDGIERETDAMEKLIDKRKEALRKQKEAYDWNKKVTDYNKDRAKLVAQISAMSGDNTKETIAKRKKLEQELRELDEDFAEERKDHEFDTVQDAYDDQLDKFKELQEKQLNLIESSLEAQKEVIGTVLESVVNNHGSAYDALEQLSKEYGFKLSSDLTNPFKDALSALEEFKKAMGDLSANTDINIENIGGSTNDVQSSTKDWLDSAKAKSAGGSWKKNNTGWWYQNADGSWPKNDWMLGQDNKWYHFDDEGYMETGWKKIKDKWYHMNGSGSMDSGWQMVGGKWYYLGGANDGSMKTGWQKLNNKWYYMDSSGAMKSGWFNDGKGWYHTDKSGAMEANKWLKSGQDWYYIGSSGKMYENQWLKDKNNWYYMNQSGAMSKGWQKVGNTWYYLGNDGIMQSSKWLKSGNDWYYLDKSGAMSTSKWIDNKYYVDHTGAMATNAYVEGYNGMYYWVDKNGEWDPASNTRYPDPKYKKVYRFGTKSSSEGVALTDEEGIGSEMFISPKGVVRDLPFGTMVFNKGQKEALWNLSKMFSSPDLSSVGFAGNVDSGLGVDIHIDNMVGNIEHIDKNALPSLERILEQSCDYTTKSLRENSVK